MVETIEIKITFGGLILYDALFIPKKNICYLNLKKYNIDDLKVNRILNIISYWNNEYGSKDGIDLQEFTIVVNSMDGETKFHGKGIFPSNYQQLLDILGDIDG